MLRLLLLGGTEDARYLATKLQQKFATKIAITYSLAGITQNPKLPENIAFMTLRQTGFGNLAGFTDALADFDAVLNATHPFATKISKNAQQACATKNIAYLRYLRSAWQQDHNHNPGLTWYDYNDIYQCQQYFLQLKSKRIFLALGKNNLKDYLGTCHNDLPNLHYFIRTIHSADLNRFLDPAQFTITAIQARPPLSEADEHAFLTENAIDTMVCRNSGGKSGYSKLRLAVKLGIHILMQNRSPQPQINMKDSVSTMAGSIAWLQQLFALTIMPK